MILQALYDLAQFEGLAQDLDFQELPVARWVILKDDGTLLNIEDRRELITPDGKKKPRLHIPRLKVPMQKNRSGRKAPAYFFVDNAKYVFGLPTVDKDFDASEGAEKSSWFREQVEKCAAATDDEGAKSVATFLADLAAGRQEVELPEDCKSNEQFAFYRSSDSGQPVHLRPAIVDYWRKLREEKPRDSTNGRRCMVTGKPMSEPGLFPQVKKLPGGTPSGVSLVSFNAPAFLSYGWKSNENAPISREAAESCATALQRLLDPAYPDPNDPGRALAERRYRLAPDTVAVYWSPQKEGQEFCDYFGDVFEPPPDPALVKEMYHALWSGRKPQIQNPAQFYAMTLTGTQGRVIVRDWLETTVEEVVGNIADYFRDIDLVRNTPPSKKRAHPPALPLQVLLRSLAVRGEGDRLPKHLAAELFHAVLTGLPFPRQVLLRALERARAEASRDEWLDLERRDGRAALVKAFLNRQRRRDESAAKRYPEITAMLDENIKNQGYILGRLMAVLEKLQEEALGDINTTLVDRYFKRASTTPLYIFKSLLNTRQSHERKLKRENHGLYVVRKRQVDELVDRISGVENIPRNLPVEEQALFLLGYHHQRHWLWSSKEERGKPAAV